MRKLCLLLQIAQQQDKGCKSCQCCILQSSAVTSTHATQSFVKTMFVSLSIVTIDSANLEDEEPVHVLFGAAAATAFTRQHASRVDAWPEDRFDLT